MDPCNRLLGKGLRPEAHGVPPKTASGPPTLRGLSDSSASDPIVATLSRQVPRLNVLIPFSVLNAFAERFVRSVKAECLDRTIFFGEGSLRHAITEYVEHHYRHERPHQRKENRLLFPSKPPDDPAPRDGRVLCRERLGGMLRFYYRAAA
jgi:hypothetical protein